MSTKPTIKAKVATTSATPTNPTPANPTTPATSAATKDVKPKLNVVAKEPTADATSSSVAAKPKKVAQVTPVQPEAEVEDENFDQYGMANEFDDELDPEAIQEYENQRMAEVFTHVLANVFTFEGISLPETILTLAQNLDTHNKIQEGILDALNRICANMESK